ncbi:unnamed protein product [Ascophyllum nodosum]
MLASLHGTNLLNLASVILLFTVFACSNSLYIAIALAINNSTDASRRGEVNGLAMTIGSIGKAVAPAACSALFAFSIDGDRPFPFDVHLVWYTAAVLRFVVGLLGWNTIRDDGGHEENPEVQLNEIGFTGIDESETSKTKKDEIGEKKVAAREKEGVRGIVVPWICFEHSNNVLAISFCKYNEMHARGLCYDKCS